MDGTVVRIGSLTHDDATRRDVYVTVVARTRARAYALSLNNQTWRGVPPLAPRNLTYYAPPSLGSIAPESGP